MSGDKPPISKPTIVRVQEGLSHISEKLDQLKPEIRRIAMSGAMGGADFEIMLACTRFVASRQRLTEMLEEQAKR